MTVSELIERLESADPDAEVRIMAQESWPFEYAIRGTYSVEGSTPCQQCGRAADDHPVDGEDVPDDEDGHEYDGFVPNGKTGPAAGQQVVYIVDGAQLAYGDRAAWENAW